MSLPDAATTCSNLRSNKRERQRETHGKREREREREREGGREREREKKIDIEYPRGSRQAMQMLPQFILLYTACCCESILSFMSEQGFLFLKFLGWVYTLRVSVAFHLLVLRV